MYKYVYIAACEAHTIVCLKSQATNSACSIQASKREATLEPNTKVFAFPLVQSCWWLGSAGRGFSAKSCERAEKSGWPSKPSKTLANQQQPVLRRRFRDASCMFTRPWKRYSWQLMLCDSARGCNLTRGEWIFKRGIVAQHVFRDR